MATTTLRLSRPTRCLGALAATLSWLIMSWLTLAMPSNQGHRVAAQEATGAPATNPTESEGWVTLFDGKTFAGWEGNLDVFRIQDGAIVGGSLDKPVVRNEFLCTEKMYQDFELRLKVKLVGQGANAGIQFRTKRIPNHHEVSGYQADMGEGWWGKLYDESRRNRILAQQAAGQTPPPVHADQWNDYRIRCEGDHIQLWLNGVATVDYRENEKSVDRSGIIAVQIHGGPPSEAWYKDIQIRVLE